MVIKLFTTVCFVIKCCSDILADVCIAKVTNFIEEYLNDSNKLYYIYLFGLFSCVNFLNSYPFPAQKNSRKAASRVSS